MQSEQSESRVGRSGSLRSAEKLKSRGRARGLVGVESAAAEDSTR